MPNRAGRPVHAIGDFPHWQFLDPGEADHRLVILAKSLESLLKSVEPFLAADVPTGRNAVASRINLQRKLWSPPGGTREITDSKLSDTCDPAENGVRASPLETLDRFVSAKECILEDVLRLQPLTKVRSKASVDERD